MMNKLTLTTVLVLFAYATFGQSQSVREFREKYEGDRDVTTVTLEGGLFKLVGFIAELSDEHDEDLEDLANLSDGIERMRILDIDDYDRVLDDEDEIDELEEDLEKEGYMVIATIREHRDDIKIYSKQSKRAELKDVVMLIEDRYDFTVLTIEGSFRFEDLNVIIDN